LAQLTEERGEWAPTLQAIQRICEILRTSPGSHWDGHVHPVAMALHVVHPYSAAKCMAGVIIIITIVMFECHRDVIVKKNFKATVIVI
jgi:hypothetical protein